MTLLLLLACSETGVNPKDTDVPVFEEGDTGSMPDTDTDDTTTGSEECNGVDDNGDGRIDEGFPDADGNGRADCVDEVCDLDLATGGPVATNEDCVSGSGSVSDPWNIEVEWSYSIADGTGVEVTPVIGNLTDDNGDGVVDADDTPDIAFTAGLSLYALSGDGSGELFVAPGFSAANGVALADVTGDGQAEILAITSDDRVKAVDGSGTVLWASAVLSLSSYPQVTVADLDGDGVVEVIADKWVVSGVDGSTLFSLTVSSSVLYRTPVAGDLDQDGTQEILLGDSVFDSTGALLWTNGGTIAGNFSALLDVDGDPEGEVFVVSGNTAYVHDSDGTELTSFPIAAWMSSAAPCVADFDGDGDPEVGVPDLTTLTVFETDGSVLWTVVSDDSSGIAGCSGWDVDGDGAYELLFGGETAFRIYDGATGAVRYEDRNHSSVTLFEYPSVADVDHDGSGEIVVANNGTFHGITVYGHIGGTGWPGAGPVWATHDYAVTNVEDDGAVPVTPEAPWQRYNLFRARPAVNGADAGTDLVASVVDVCVADCDYGPVQLGLRVANQGPTDAAAGTKLAVYALDPDPRLVHVVELAAIPAGTALDDLQVDLGAADIGSAGFRIVIDDDGTGAGALAECDETNNLDDWADTFCP